MNRTATAIVVIVLVALGLLYSGTYTVHESQTAIKFRLGEIIKTDIEPGLHFKVPFINNTRKFDLRVQTLDEEPQQFLTQNKKNLIVDAFVKWRIGEVRRYYTTVGGEPRRANQRLSEIIRNSLREQFRQRTIPELVSGDRVAVMKKLEQDISSAAVSLGLEVLDVRIKRIDLPDRISESVYDRMASERQRVAKELRAEGAREAEEIRASADRQRQVILAEARRDSQRTRGEGDARAAEIYANAYNDDREFYSFYRSLQAYRETFSAQDDLIVLSPDSAFFRYFDSVAPQAGDE
ncbi:protease modulator HflC [Ectothiorhodospiraceae bacterium WFHF3C12]|nr:protease modulator HflC [Ectothiorhodospiraceae bacterium WFHF3C12]